MNAGRTLGVGAAVLLLAGGGAMAQCGPWPVAQVAQRLGPSVVGVVNLGPDPATGRLGARASGSGVVLRGDGYVVTNYHVVAGASHLRLVVSGGRSLPARLVGVDPATDLALLHAAGLRLRPVRWAPSRQVQVGEMAIAIGNPMGLGFARSVTLGVVSGVERSLGVGYAHRAYDLIQTDAAINPGNSGGALADCHGQVIGINSVKIAAPGVEGMGFAIPADTVLQVTRQLLAHGRVDRPWLGVSLLSPEAQARLGFGDGNPPGLKVLRLYPGGPAARAGIREGDRLTAVRGRRVSSLEDLYRALGTARVGERIEVEVWRHGRRERVTLVLGPWPRGRAGAAEVPRP